MTLTFDTFEFDHVIGSSFPCIIKQQQPIQKIRNTILRAFLKDSKNTASLEQKSVILSPIQRI